MALATPQLESQEVAEFEAGFQRTVIGRTDPGYDEARAVWNGMIDKYPALVARCTGVADVVRAVTFAEENDLLVAVRGGGHNVAGTAVCDDGIVIDLSAMNGVVVHPDERTARVQAGATWGEVDSATQQFGLVTPGGVVSMTGVAGLTLGGGYSHLRCKYGLTSDNLRSVNLVTADGEFITASEGEHADLFWALRGGGGNFGVVTSFEFDLHELGPEVMHAGTAYPLETAPAVLRQWREFIDGAPDEISSDAVLWSIPEYEDFPPELHGTPVIITAGVYAGPVEEGREALQPLREFGEPLIDLSGVDPYTHVQQQFDPFFQEGVRAYWKSRYLDGLDDGTIEDVGWVSYVLGVDPPERFKEAGTRNDVDHHRISLAAVADSEQVVDVFEAWNLSFEEGTVEMEETDAVAVRKGQFTAESDSISSTLHTAVSPAPEGGNSSHKGWSYIIDNGEVSGIVEFDVTGDTQFLGGAERIVETAPSEPDEVPFWAAKNPATRGVGAHFDVSSIDSQLRDPDKVTK